MNLLVNSPTSVNGQNISANNQSIFKNNDINDKSMQK